MKICMISNLYPPYILGGAEIVVAEVANALQERGHDLLVITSSPDNKDSVEVRDHVKVYQVHPWNIYPTYHHSNQSPLKKPVWHGLDVWNWKSYQSITHILEEETPDVVHIHNFKGLSLAVFDAVKKCKVPLVFTAHDCSLICPRANLLKGNGELCQQPSWTCQMYSSINRRIINHKVDWFTAPSQFIIDQLHLNGFFKNTNTTKIPLGLNLITFHQKKNYNMLDIAYMGSLNRIKGVQNLINAFKMVEGDNIRLHIFGQGIDEDEFKLLAGNDPRIKFHGFIDREKLMEQYSQANITVQPSICYDNSPMMIYESLMSSTPVIGSRIGGIPELIEDGVNGYLYEPGNEKELMEILKKINDNPEILKKMEENAHFSAQKYDIINHLQALEKIYHQLISKN